MTDMETAVKAVRTLLALRNGGAERIFVRGFDQEIGGQPGHPALGDAMLGANEVMATVAVRDLRTARQFYEGKLGLTARRTGEAQVVNYKTGSSTLMVYVSQYAGTNKATAATWVVDGIEEIVATLKSKGVAFEHYDLPGLEHEGDLHVAGGFKTAWFKDPDGNILSLVTK